VDHRNDARSAEGLGSDNNKNGAYTFLDYNFNLRYHVGFLLDLADQDVAPYGKQLSLGPNATWFLSDNTRLRCQYTHTTALGSERPEEKSDASSHVLARQLEAAGLRRFLC